MKGGPLGCSLLMLLLLVACAGPLPAEQAVVGVAVVQGEGPQASPTAPPPIPATPQPVVDTPEPRAATTATAEPQPSPSPLPTRRSLLNQSLPPVLVASEAPPPTATPPVVPQTFGGPGWAEERVGEGFATAVQAADELAFVKIGFHVGPDGDAQGLGEWMRQLDAAGVPFFLKSADSAGQLLEAQELMRISGVPHTLVYRRSSDQFELPNYEINPVQAAREHWALHVADFPPELDPSLVWLETINEVDKGRSEWLGIFAYETARLALRDGYRWAAFGWSSGEPEIVDWTAPEMTPFLQLAAAYPDQLAIALHEYSYDTDNIFRQKGSLVGRFQQLFWVCDQLGIRRPTVLITEFGWEYRDIPPPAEAMYHVQEAARLYAAYPEVKGAAIWYLGGRFGEIDVQTKQLIAPLTEYALTHYFEVTPYRTLETADFE